MSTILAILLLGGLIAFAIYQSVSIIKQVKLKKAEKKENIKKEDK